AEPPEVVPLREDLLVLVEGVNLSGRERERALQVSLCAVRVAEDVRREDARVREHRGLRGRRQALELLVTREPLVRERQLRGPIVARRRRVELIPERLVALPARERRDEDIQDGGFVFELLLQGRGERFDAQRGAGLRIGHGAGNAAYQGRMHGQRARPGTSTTWTSMSPRTTSSTR